MRYGEHIFMNMMKTFIFLCCFTTFAFSSKAGFSQNSKIVIKTDSSLTVEEVFELIKEQTEYTFIYRSDLFTNAPKVAVKKGIIKTETLLKKSLSYGNIIYSFTPDGAILLEKTTDSGPSAPQILVSGMVTDHLGAPLPGATVSIKGNETTGTQTDFDGNYSIRIPSSNTILVFRYLGFTTKEITVGSNTTINVTLQEDAQSLDEIVVIGYGTQKKSDVNMSYKYCQE